MTPLRRIAFIGNSLPRHCGIATFTTDLQQAVSISSPNLQTTTVAMTDHGQTYDYPASVALQIKDGNVEEYAPAGSTRFACSTSSEFSAAMPALISSCYCHALPCQ